MTKKRHTPERTCIAVRRTADSTTLLRCVLQRGSQAGNGSGPVVVPDPERVLPGRGAWLTPTVEAYGLAVKKRAFNRAFKVSTPVDASAVLTYIVAAAPDKDTMHKQMKRMTDN